MIWLSGGQAIPQRCCRTGASQWLVATDRMAHLPQRSITILRQISGLPFEFYLTVGAFIGAIEHGQCAGFPRVTYAENIATVCGECIRP